MKYPFEPFKIDGKFGDKRSPTYVHEGLDFNLPSGGNTDCGLPLFPITDGTIVHTSKSSKGFGNILVYKIVGVWGTRWVRYAHIDETLVTAGLVASDKAICTMGSTGNSTACHLHWDIFKKSPDGNWRLYAKDKQMLNEYWEDPLQFVEKYKEEVSDMTQDEKRALEFIKVFKDNTDELKAGNYEGAARAVTGAFTDLENYKKFVKEIEEKCEKRVQTALNKQNDSFTREKQEIEEKWQSKMETAKVAASPKTRIASMLSRKWIAAVVGVIIPIFNNKLGLDLSASELMVVLAPILMYIGAEGWADIKERSPGEGE